MEAIRKQSQCSRTTVKDLPGQLLEQVLAHVSFRERCGGRLGLILTHMCARMYASTLADTCALLCLPHFYRTLSQGQGCSRLPQLASALVTAKPSFVAGRPGSSLCTMFVVSRAF